MRWRLRGYLRRTITYPWARRIAVAVIGGTIVLVGIAMVVLPGPAIIVIPLGLGVLGLEFAWARHWLRKLRSTASDVVNRVRGRPKDPPHRHRSDRHGDHSRALRPVGTPRSLPELTRSLGGTRPVARADTPRRRSRGRGRGDPEASA